jgi:hypothetical protein
MRRARALQLEINEMSNPANAGVYYLSFATEGEFLGGVFIEAHGIITATEKAHELGINPGGEVACWGPVPPPVASAMDRLLSKEEVETVPPADIRIKDIANERKLHDGEDECGATHPQIGHGKPCIRFKGHAEYDGQRNHITESGEWFA